MLLTLLYTLLTNTYNLKLQANAEVHLTPFISKHFLLQRPFASVQLIQCSCRSSEAPGKKIEKPGTRVTQGFLIFPSSLFTLQE